MTRRLKKCFVIFIFGNAGDTRLPENDAALDAEHWTGHTGCVILAPHLITVTKKDAGLPHFDQATDRQKRDGMCWKKEDELYNDGGAFKITSRDHRGVVVTLIADNYFGYCKKEVKTQISYAANLFGFCEEEHAGGALVYPSYDLGEEFSGHLHVKRRGHSFQEVMKLYASLLNFHPEGYATDREHPDIVKKYFGTIIPPNDNKFAALNSAVWSGGSFIYVPPGVEVEMPLQAYFRINAENMGQFERTLIIADEGSKVHYIEGCSAPTYTTDSLHSAVVEIVVKPSARVTYTTIQNWSSNVFNLVTKRARVEAEGHMEWIDGNIGSRLTMKYPAVYMVGPKASGEVLSVAYAGPGQHQDAGAKMIHMAPYTQSSIVSKSIARGGVPAGDCCATLFMIRTTDWYSR